ncbi:Fad synthetase, putative [Candida maltosa Xu316]|uniref:FAD synthase n=1 Tax=Candida maltosa (strain Xu316) TaxID=1245528 RepID=M3HQD8_CANMX|nr:Fad synthetase, putative [Candida maltosa Xu316]
MTNQHNRDIQIGFLHRCAECYTLVQDFLNDRGHTSIINGDTSTSTVHKEYQFDPELRESVKQKVLLSIEKLEKSIDLHLQEIAISYNGGKDCLVMLILLMATIHKKFSSTTFENPVVNLLPPDYKLDSIYINSETPFPELLEFIKTSTEYYHLHPIIIKSTLKDGFQQYLDQVNKKVKSVVVGIRHSDPYGETLSYEQMTDHNWPKFLRIHPILHWNYVDIWDFLIGCNVKYCDMYDRGYTSLGGVDTTIPNPLLKLPTGKYLPAYMLKHNADESERLGRVKK